MWIFSLVFSFYKIQIKKKWIHHHHRHRQYCMPQLRRRIHQHRQQVRQQACHQVWFLLCRLWLCRFRLWSSKFLGPTNFVKKTLWNMEAHFCIEKSSCTSLKVFFRRLWLDPKCWDDLSALERKDIRHFKINCFSMYLMFYLMFFLMFFRCFFDVQ